jgi:hypothetical protein
MAGAGYYPNLEERNQPTGVHEVCVEVPEGRRRTVS